MEEADFALGDYIRVACVTCGWGDENPLFAVDRYASDSPPIPYSGLILEVYASDTGDPDDRVLECAQCHLPFDDPTQLRPARA